MNTRNFRLVFLLSVMALLLTTFAPFGTQYAMMAPDPEGESQVAYTMTNTSGDPSGTLSAAYILDDTSAVFNMDGGFYTNETRTFSGDLNSGTNTYTVSTLSSGTYTPSDLPPVYGASLAIRTVKNDTGRDQVKTADALSWVRSGSTVGYYCYNDDYHLFSTSITGGLSWSIKQGTPDPPYTSSPYNTNVINDVWGKYKNFDYLDANYSTTSIHVISLSHYTSDPDNYFRYSISAKMKGEGKGDFHFKVDVNADLCHL